ncbi:MAG: NAD(P)H-hydrate dehydratase [Dehalococcoidales bacterium]|nr:NAD(P)H-hydrate dehydratase [Dehalococcoidales bacterium]
MKVTTVAEMRAMDNTAITKYHKPAATLMENAGHAAYQVIKKEFGLKNKKFVVVCGGGNNGGDGFVVARKLHSDGARVTVLLLSKKDKYEGAARQNLDMLSGLPIPVKEVSTITKMKKDTANSDCIVDAIFGTGLARNVEGIYRDVIEAINKSKKIVFSLDIASGINGDSGQEMGISIKADYTITFGLPKIGNLLYPGYARGGKLYISHISFPPALYNAATIKTGLTPLSPLPERKPDTSKMDYGPVLVIAGAANYYWAPYASAYSVLKAGGGYVFLACPESIAPVVAKKGREIVFQPMPETDTGSIALIAKDKLLELAARVKMVVIGPGLSLNEETQQLVRELTQKIDKPLLVDGDGITAIARDTDILQYRKAKTILTPHLGEMSRLTGEERRDIEKDRLAVLREAARKLNSIVVMKGPHSLIGYPDGKVFINASGTTGGQAGMATAGSGDVLNGTIAAMYCLELKLEEAVRMGVFMHGIAGDIAAVKKGADGMTARDILNNLPYAVKNYRKNFTQIAANYYNSLFTV